ncbi:MAG: glycosyltransferase [Gemmatimonas sp.]|nr:glycosyltransferase [Gemmatimonas sp.]
MSDVMVWSLIIGPLILAMYTYIGYPLILRLLARFERVSDQRSGEHDWPMVSITLAAYNEEGQIRGTIENLLEIDYPTDRREIVVVSDASTDRTDEIVSEYLNRGVKLIRAPERGGKGAAEAAAAPHLRGEVIVNTDASVRIRPDALKPLIETFAHPAVGLASGRDVSVSRLDDDVNLGESGYVGYEMWIRALETRVSGIVGASGCFYAIRAHLHRAPLPASLSRDFASAMITREHGYRSVSVDEAICLVPRAGSLGREYRRKVRTITRGMRTLWYKRRLLDPARFGLFAWMLFSHKVCRWLVPWAGLAAVVGIVAASTTMEWAAWASFGIGLGSVLAGAGWLLKDRPRVPRLFSVPAFLLAGNAAAIHAGMRVLRGGQDAVWEPTRRDAVAAAR